MQLFPQFLSNLVLHHPLCLDVLFCVPPVLPDGPDSLDYQLLPNT